MAARRKSSSSNGSPLGRIASTVLLLLAGVIVGYVWRSYLPMALPFESRLVADRSSEQVADSSLKELVRSSTDRASKAERERDQLRTELAGLKSNQQKTERELAEMQIKSVLSEGTPQ